MASVAVSDSRNSKAVGVANGVADRLGQCGRGHECRHQHDVFDLAGGQSLVQSGSIHRISPGDARRRRPSPASAAPSRVPKIAEIT